MGLHRGRAAAGAGIVAQVAALLLPFFVPTAIAAAQKPATPGRTTHAGPQPELEIENPRPTPPSRKSRKKNPTDAPTIQFRYQISPGPSGVTAARIEIWDRPDLLVKIPVRIAKSGEATWIDASSGAPERLDFALIDPNAPGPNAANSCVAPCTGARSSPEPVFVTVAGDDVPPSFDAVPARVRAGSETMSLDLDGTFLTSSTKVLLAEPGSKEDLWKAWEFLPVEFIDAGKIRVTIPWSYLASPRKLTLWPLSLDEVEAAEGNGLALGGTEQKTPLGGGTKEVVYVAGSSSPVLSHVEPAQLRADASDQEEASVTLHGSGFTRTSAVVAGLDPFEDGVLHNPPLVLNSKFISSEVLEIHIPASLLRYPDVAYSQPGPIRVWVKNSDNGFLISEPRAIQILPTDQARRAPQVGIILAVSPSPLPLMTAGGPPGVEVTVIGRNFRANDTIVARIDEGDKVKLPTQYVSSTELRVSLPRQLWRDHRISYRFVIVTAQGERATEIYEDGDGPDADPASSQ